MGEDRGVASWQEAGHASSLVAVPDDPPGDDAGPGGADAEPFAHEATPTALEAEPFAYDDPRAGRAKSSAREPGVHRGDPRPDPLASGDDEPVAALEVLGVSKRFGGVAALSDVTLRVMPGEIVGVIGSNGAGKTTLFDVCSGFVVPDAGRVRLFGRDITTMSPARRAAVGLGRVFQDSRLFPGMTVAEVLRTSLERVVPVRDALACALRLTAVIESEEYLETRVDDILAAFGLERFREHRVSELSSGTRRVVELASAFGHESRVLLLDEPSAGIAQRESEALGELLLDVREQTGAAFVVIEHDVPLVSAVADRLSCLHLGSVIAEGPTAGVLDDPLVMRAYLGADPTDLEGASFGVTRGPLRASG
jgi:branched-chain amino acid transport system ATP-binding protein